MNKEIINWLDIGIEISDIESICLNCKNEDNIPDFIYDE